MCCVRFHSILPRLYSAITSTPIQERTATEDKTASIIRKCYSGKYSEIPLVKNIFKSYANRIFKKSLGSPSQPILKISRRFQGLSVLLCIKKSAPYQDLFFQIQNFLKKSKFFVEINKLLYKKYTIDLVQFFYGIHIPKNNKLTKN